MSATGRLTPYPHGRSPGHFRTSKLVGTLDLRGRPRTRHGLVVGGCWATNEGPWLIRTERTVSDSKDLPHDDWNNQARGETEIQRLDRNFGEVLQELRVAQTGVQILFAFLLTLAFTPRFGQITAFQLDLYVAALLLTTGATGLLIAPVAYHRVTFRQRMRAPLVSAANRFALGGLTFLMLALTCSVLFITDVVLSRRPAIIITSVVACWFLLLWYLLPLTHLFQHKYDRGPDE